MKQRSVNKYTSLQHFNVGPFQVKQPLPNDSLEQVSPFILLHHAGPTKHHPEEIKARLSPHPHRGFEPVTFLFNGKIHHKDSTGSEGFLESGDVQWMTSGSGIIHSEGPSEEFAKEGGEMELIQLWVNLPQAYKMTAPKYQDIKKDSIPLIEEDGFSYKVVAGKFKNVQGPASTFSPLIAAMVSFTEHAATTIRFPDAYNVMVYVLNGSLNMGQENFETNNLGVFNRDGEGIDMQATTSGKLLLLAGEPINEPMVSYGPFVMNYPGELKQALLYYQSGKMGELIN